MIMEDHRRMININVLNQLNDTLEELEVHAELDREKHPHKVIIRLKGYLNHLNTADFAEGIMEFFRGDWKDLIIVLDLSELLYISSSGIGSFTTIRMQADHKDCPLYLAGMNDKVNAVFEQLGFSAFFNLIDSPEALPE